MTRSLAQYKLLRSDEAARHRLLSLLTHDVNTSYTQIASPLRTMVNRTGYLMSEMLVWSAGIPETGHHFARRLAGIRIRNPLPDG